MAFLPEVAAQTIIIQRNVELSNHYFALEQESQDHEIGMHQTNPGSSINDYQYIEDFADTGNASDTTSSDLSSTDDSDDGCETGFTSNDESCSDDETTVTTIKPVQREFSEQDTTCMAILWYVSKHCITGEGAKDLIELIKIVCPDNETLKDLNYGKCQEVCGKCEVLVYEKSDVCLQIFPTSEEIYTCSTEGCQG